MPRVVDHEQRREDIIAAVWRVVARDGFSSVTVRSVAAEANLNPATVALAFGSRTELLIQAYADLYRRDDRQLARLLKQPMSVDVLVEATLLALPLTSRRTQHAAVWIALLDAAGHDEQAAAAVADFGLGLSDRIREILRQAVEQGVLRPATDVEVQVILAHAIVDGFAVQVAATGAPKKPDIRSALWAYFSSLTQ